MRTLFSILAGGCLALVSVSATAAETSVRETVDGVVPALMQREGIPGMAVAVIAGGEVCFCNYGVASRDTGAPVTNDTLFEIGSLSKTFTATLAAYAQEDGKLFLTDRVSRHLPALSGSRFDQVSLTNLATHTTGGLPLQVPEKITNNAELFDYLRHWEFVANPGTLRVYSNVGIGLLGVVVAEVLHRPFEDAMEKNLFPKLGLTHSFIRVPEDQAGRYAQGYTTKDRPIRVSPGVLDAEAYGIKSCSADLARYLMDHLAVAASDGWLPGTKMLHALAATRTGYYTAGELTQDLIWEQYPYPVELSRLLAGNADAMILGSTPSEPLRPPLPPQDDVWINKTGSTNGFAAYVAFVPGRHLGVVLLANKRYDIAARVTAAYEILTRVEKLLPPR